MIRNPLNIFIWWLAVMPLAALAFQPLITDDTETQGEGGNQIEAGYDRTKDKTSSSRTITHEIPLVYTRGITEGLDLYAGGTRTRIAPDAPAATESGWSNPVLGAKWRFYDNQARKISFALKPELSIGVSGRNEARGLGTSKASYGVGLMMAQETGFGSLLANLQADRVNYADDRLNAAVRRTRYRVSVAPVWDIAEGWKLALDTGLMTGADRAAKARTGYVELGVLYAQDKDLDFAFGIIRNNHDGVTQTTRLTSGFTWRFK